MKKSILLFVLLSSQLLFGQSVKFGITGGLNVSNTSFNVSVDGNTSGRKYKNREAYYIGGSIEIPFNTLKSKKSLIVEILYSEHGTTGYYITNRYDDLFVLDEVIVPVLIKQNIFKNFYFLAGGYAGYVFSAKEVNSAGVEFIQKDYYNFDSGVILGIRFQFGVNFYLDTRYIYGLSDVSNVSYPYSKVTHQYYNRVFQVGLGYYF